jgi:RNA polymerase sigma-70 factor, ECF subfamily
MNSTLILSMIVDVSEHRCPIVIFLVTPTPRSASSTLTTLRLAWLRAAVLPGRGERRRRRSGNLYRAWWHLPRLRADGRPIRPWLFRVVRNLLTGADRTARARPVTVPVSPAVDPGDESRLGQVLDRQLLCDAFVICLLRTGRCWWRPSTGADPRRRPPRRRGIPGGTARSRLHYALHALREHLQDQCAAACQ